MKFAPVLSIIFIFFSLKTEAAYYPFPPKVIPSHGIVGPIYGSDYLANHAYSINLALKEYDIHIERNNHGQISGFSSTDPDGGAVEILWSGNTLVYVHLSVIPSAPALVMVTDSTFLKFIQDVVHELEQKKSPPLSQHPTWEDFLTQRWGSLKNQYSISELANLINKDSEVRIRFKLIPETVFKKLGLVKINGTPFKVIEDKGSLRRDLNKTDLVQALNSFSLHECEKALQTMPVTF